MSQPTSDNTSFSVTKVRALHIALLLAAFAISTAMILLPVFLGRHLLAGSGTRLFQYATGGMAMVMVLVAVGVLRSRVPTRGGEPLSEYWDRQAPVTAAVTTWAVMEGAATVAAMGYLVSGGLVPLVGMMAGLVGLLVFSPARLAGG